MYITGLPIRVTPESIQKVFGKYGVILEDIETGVAKIKMYKTEDGFRGEALVVYFKEESVKLACTMLDDTFYDLHDDMKDYHSVIKVQPVCFGEMSHSRLCSKRNSRKIKYTANKP